VLVECFGCHRTWWRHGVDTTLASACSHCGSRNLTPYSNDRTAALEAAGVVDHPMGPSDR